MSATKTIVVFGAGGHAKVVAEALRSKGYSIAAFVDDVTPGRQGERFCGSTVIDELPKDAGEISPSPPLAIVAIGTNHARVAKARIAKTLGFRFPVVIHPRAFVASNTTICEGTFVSVNATIGPDTRVGSHVIVNTAACIDHDCIVGDGVHVGPGAVVAGNVALGEGTFIGAGAVLIDHVNIGKWCVVGAGSVVIRDIPDEQTVVGVPAASIPRAR